ncbi:unnamed protein product [Plutella xylostella]|uniref:(diamondback moth) hypothetical protein n=1 Tax=Plutella xylostella TaxID=51655 RepID=A0A8S4DDK7_PLUXY|nr:unnamed protein product [Plutella xylostella]
MFEIQRAHTTKIAPHGSPLRAYIAYHKLGPAMDAGDAPPECRVHPSVLYLLGTLLLTRFIIEVNENDDEDEDVDDDEQVQTESEHESDMEIDL